MIVTKPANGGDAEVFLAERLTTVQLDDPHFAAQLVERLRWAGADAESAERKAAGGSHSPRCADLRVPSMQH